MARKQKTSPIEDLTALVAMLPWWAGIALALASYLLLHRLAEQPVTTTAAPGQMGAMLTQTLWKTLATFGQYLVPLICVIGAGISAWKRRERRALLVKVSDSSAADVLDGMSWQQFERLVGEAFRLHGYSVVETGGGGADGGVDLILSKDGEKFLVQCKQWKALKVSVSVVRELYGVMAAKGAVGGFVVTSGRFTDEASAFASGRNVSLIDGRKLKALIAGARGEPALCRPEPQVPTPVAPGHTGKAAQPDCPLCAKPMVKRMAKRGTNAGTEFWGCTAYPACRGTRPVS